MRAFSHTEKLLHIGAATTLGALLVSGCSENAIDEVRQQVAAEQMGIDRSQACPDEEEKRTEEQARLCNTFKTTGKIALVGYHLKDSLLQQIAQEAEKQTNKTYGTTISITAIPASESLSALLDSANPSCISNEHPVSWSAAKVMKDDLEAYGAIVGAASVYDCDNAVSGWHIADKGQFAEAVGVTDTATSVPTIVHEIGHILGLGHAGQFFINGDSAGEYIVPYIFSAEETAAIDISNITNASDFNAYGDGCNIMGSESYCPQLNGMDDANEITADYPFYINPVQESMLDWANEYASAYVTTLEKGNTTLLNTGEEHGIATIQLEEPILFDGYAGGTDGTFDKLSFTANCAPDRYNWAYRCVDIYAHNNNSTAFIGSLVTFDAAHTTKTTIKIHNKIAEVNITKQYISVTHVA